MKKIIALPVGHKLTPTTNSLSSEKGFAQKSERRLKPSGRDAALRRPLARSTDSAARCPCRVGRSLLREPSANGFTLIECLIYISVLAVILTVGSAAFYRCWDDNKAITHNTEDVVQTLKAGELWRADVRQATGPIEVTTANAQQKLRIPCKGGAFLYTFADGEVRRQANGEPWRVVIERVESSQMQNENRGNVTAWRWELELQSRRKHARVRPLFTFEAVAGKTLLQ